MGIKKIFAGNTKNGGGGLLAGLHSAATPDKAVIASASEHMSAAPAHAAKKGGFFSEGHTGNNMARAFAGGFANGMGQEDDPMVVPQMQNQGVVPMQMPQAAFAGNPFFDPTGASRLMRPNFGGYRRRGGKVKRGEAYVVGEDGPEVIVPEKSGTVIPHDKAFNPRFDGEGDPAERLIRQMPPDSAIPLGTSKTPSDAVPLGGRLNNPYAPNPAAPRTSEELLNIPPDVLDGPQRGLTDTSSSIIPKGVIPDFDRNPEFVRATTPVVTTPTQAAVTQPVSQQTAGQPVNVNADEEQPAEVPDRMSRLMRPDMPSDQTWQQIQDLQDYTDPHKHSAAGRGFKGAVKSYKNWEGGPGSGGIFGLLTSILGGGISSAVSPKAYENLEKDTRERRLFRQLGQQQARETFESGQATKEAQRRNIDDDNAARDDRNLVLKQQGEAKIATTRLKNFTDRIWKAQKYFDPTKASEFDKKELGGLGLKPEDIGTFDFRHSDTKTVNGVTFNFRDGAWTESGLPTDGSKELVEYTVVDPDNVPHKFKVTSDRAAAFYTSIKAAGMQIQAAADRQQSQQTFTAGQNAEDRKLKVRQWALANKVTRAKFKADLADKVSTGKLTQAQADAAIADFPDDIQE